MEEKVKKASVAASTILRNRFSNKKSQWWRESFPKEKKRLGDKNFQSPKSPFDRKHIMRFRKGAKEEVIVAVAKASFSVRPFSKKDLFSLHFSSFLSQSQFL